LQLRVQVELQELVVTVVQVVRTLLVVQVQQVVQVARWLRDKGRLAQVGGPSYLAQLTDATPAIAHVEHHAKVIREKWRLRQLIATCQRVSAEGYGDVGTVATFIEEASSAIEAIRGDSADAANDPQHIAHVAREAFTTIERHAESGGRMLGRSTGFARLDAKTAGMHDGETFIIAGRSGHGKSAAALNIAVNMASPQEVTDEWGRPTGETTPGVGVGIFSLEMPREQVVVRMFCSASRVDLGKMRAGCLQAQDWTALTGAAGTLSALPIWIDDTAGLTLAALRGKARMIAREAEQAGTRLGLLVVDHISLMAGTGRENSVEEVVAGNSQGLHELAKEMSIPIIILAQLNREVEKRGKNGRPMLSDLRSSGSLEQDADTIMFVWNPDVAAQGETQTGIVEWIIGKNRSGPLGKVLVKFVAACTRFEDFGPGEYPQEQGE
jgi:replicative DNA helicase